MRKSKSNPSDVSISPFFKPENVGEFIEGKFGGFERGKIENKTVDCMKIGNRKISISVVIFSFLKRDSLATKLKAGRDTVKIQYVGKKGRAKLFNFFVNGKQMEQDFAGEKVDAASVLKNRPLTLAESKRK